MISQDSFAQEFVWSRCLFGGVDATWVVDSSKEVIRGTLPQLLCREQSGYTNQETCRANPLESRAEPFPSDGIGSRPAG